MTVATDLQTLVADVPAAIASGKPMGRTELEVMRRTLSAVATEARAEEKAGTLAAMVLRDLFAGIENRAADLSGLAAFQRERLGAVLPRAPGVH